MFTTLCNLVAKLIELAWSVNISYSWYSWIWEQRPSLAVHVWQINTFVNNLLNVVNALLIIFFLQLCPTLFIIQHIWFIFVAFNTIITLWMSSLNHAAMAHADESKTLHVTIVCQWHCIILQQINFTKLQYNVIMIATCMQCAIHVAKS